MITPEVIKNFKDWYEINHIGHLKFFKERIEEILEDEWEHPEMKVVLQMYNNKIIYLTNNTEK